MCYTVSTSSCFRYFMFSLIIRITWPETRPSYQPKMLVCIFHLIGLLLPVETSAKRNHFEYWKNSCLEGIWRIWVHIFVAHSQFSSVVKWVYCRKGSLTILCLIPRTIVTSRGAPKEIRRKTHHLCINPGIRFWTCEITHM